MNRMRSPNYPAIPLDRAIDLVGEIHRKSRANVISREAAAQDMGYSGLTGHSIKLLGALAQFGLVERAGKGDLKVTQIAVDILHGLDENVRSGAMRVAGAAPKLFQSIYERFPDGIPSENVIRSYLIQLGYADVALTPVIKSFLETNRFLELAAASESHGGDGEDGANSLLPVEDEKQIQLPAVIVPAQTPPAQQGGYRIMEGERVVFSEETGAEQYLKLVASGPLDDSLLEALEDYIRRQRKRLGA